MFRWLLPLEYRVRPKQLLKRLSVAAAPWRRRSRPKLPWGLPLLVDRDDPIGDAVRKRGLFHLPFSETLWRVTGEHDAGLDAAGGGGYALSILALRSDSVFLFEPDDILFQRAEHNSATWQTLRTVITLHHRPDPALLPQEGTGVLALGERDHGLRLIGHAGAGFDIRDVVFPCAAPHAAGTTAQLLEAGYSIVRVDPSPTGPLVVAAEGPKAPVAQPDSAFLATRRMDRLRELFAPRNWKCLRG